jgi:hypothetical protein
VGFLQNLAKKRAILIQRQILVIFFRYVIRRRRDHQVDGIIGEQVHRFTTRTENAIQDIGGKHLVLCGFSFFIGRRGVQSGIVESGRIVTNAAGGTERGCCCFPAGLLLHERTQRE